VKGQPDHFFRRAKAEGFEARSVYKLSEADAKHRLLRQGQRVLDLGASPGSWAQYALPKIGPTGFLLAVDRNDPKAPLPDNAQFIRGDCLDPATADAIAPHAPFDLLLSDMAPNTSGIRFVDHQRSLDLARAALAIAERVLRAGGSAFVKVFEGEDLPAFRKLFSAQFQKVSVEKPAASRNDSVELFLLGRGFRRSRATAS